MEHKRRYVGGLVNMFWAIGLELVVMDMHGGKRCGVDELIHMRIFLSQAKDFSMLKYRCPTPHTYDPLQHYRTSKGTQHT